MNKSNLGALIILGGVAIIGFVWFRRNKPTTSDKQLAELIAKSNSIADSIDKPFVYTEEQKKNRFKNPYTSSWSLLS